jgi:hypothetical protein
VNASRRGFFKLLASFGAAPVLDRVARLLPAAVVERIGIIPRSPLGVELVAVTRKALIPSVYTQIYKSHPLLALFEDSAAGRRRADPIQVNQEKRS